MGVYLNSKAVYNAYREIYSGPYFVDKSLMLDEIIPRIGTGEKYICITRPRRFGKSVMANMIASFLSMGCTADEIFDQLKIADKECCRKNLNQHNVISIPFNEVPADCTGYRQYITRIEKRLKRDLIRAFPDADIDRDDAVWDILTDLYENGDSMQFVFILDEWDFVFHRDFMTDQDKKSYIEFLNNLLKDKPYVSLAYMTGILPIAKYSSGSELNMFAEYTMASEEMYSDYFGFTESEVDDLYSRFLGNQSDPQVTREGLRIWYDGYHTRSGERVYNPRSVVLSLTNNNLGNYWTSAGPYDEIYYYINHNVAEVRDDLAQMISGIPVPAKVSEYAATSMNLTTKDEIFSAMIVYGFLSYEDGCVSIPNKELMDKFQDMLLKESSLGYVNRLAKESGRMLKATLDGDTETMVKILEYTHNTENPLLSYSNESDLTTIVNLVYLQARDTYRIEREDKAGVGYVDFIFYPEMNKQADGIILELKAGHTAEEALQQIKDRKYALKFEGHLGEKAKYTGRILGVGIAYDKNTKVHECKIEVLREAIR
ncbi:MAG: AAA family ATPase [Lachnospiraceae bacterium]|nr:AAA family ATPase [Lachnospiraceae bacterium]MDY4970966.1 AAA family ATPase [Lachnospiraceae bacterium]